MTVVDHSSAPALHDEEEKKFFALCFLLTDFQLFSSYFFRCSLYGAGGAVHPEAAPVLRRLRLHGSGGRSKGEGDQARHTQ
jgi:hypothetical protein